MCGIIGYLGTRDPKETLLNSLRRLEYRGYDSAGVAIRENGEISLHRAEGRIENLESKLADFEFSGTSGIGHTRWATHGAPVERNAHPHQVGSVVLVHNGIIENYAELRSELGSDRITSSETDTEIVAHLVDEEVERGLSLVEAVRKTLPRIRGTYAFVMMSKKEPNLLVGVRNGSPLLIGLGDDEFFLASDVQAFLEMTNRVVFLQDHEFAVCTSDSYSVFEICGKQLQPKISKLSWKADDLDKLGYEHFMQKEIHEQPQALANTIEGNIDFDTEVISLLGLSSFRERIKMVERVSIVACGTSMHAALIGKYYIEQFARVPVDVDFGSEFRYRNPVLQQNMLCVFISQSGETADTLAALREAKGREIPCLAICNVRGSTLARESNWVLFTNAGPEIGVASTKAFTTQLAVLYMLGAEIGYLKASLFEKQYRDLTQALLKLPIYIEKTLELDSQLESLAKQYQSLECFFYVGRGINYPIALEGALKLKEISYLHAEGYPAGELKHGPIALITDKVLTLALIPSPSTDPPHSYVSATGGVTQTNYEKMISNLEEVKARGGKVIYIGSEGDERFSKDPNFVGVPLETWGLTPILMSIPVQLFAYHVARLKGEDVDKPRNLAKSVTVE